MCSLFPALRQDPLFTQRTAEQLSSLLDCAAEHTLAVRARASWAIANLCYAGRIACLSSSSSAPPSSSSAPSGAAATLQMQGGGEMGNGNGMGEEGEDAMMMMGPPAFAAHFLLPPAFPSSPSSFLLLSTCVFSLLCFVLCKGSGTSDFLSLDFLSCSSEPQAAAAAGSGQTTPVFAASLLPPLSLVLSREFVLKFSAATLAASSDNEKACLCLCL